MGRWSHFVGVKNNGYFVGMRKGFLGKEVFELADVFDGPATLPYFKNIGIVWVERIL